MFLQTVRTAIEALNARRMRSILTLLGILIGIAAVMLTVGLGQGATEAITNQINALGSNMLIVTPGSTTSGSFRGASSFESLTEDDATMLADKDVVPDVAAVAPVYSGSASLRSATTTWTSQMYGTVPDYLEVRAKSVDTGRFFTKAELEAHSSVAVIGTTTAEELFSGQEPIGQSLQINSQTFTVIGVLAESGSSLTGDEDDVVIVPSTTYGDRFAEGAALSSIYLEAASSDRLAAAQQEVNKALLSAHQVTADNMDFTVSTQQSLVETVESITALLTLLLGGIAAISLLVGGIGVMNIMLVSVSERVREIGLRKALGATPGVIRQQFLVEAAILGLTGGLLGVGLGFGGAAAINPFLTEQNMTVSISMSATLIALAVAMTIGIVAGVYPASRAAKMAPIDALRSE